MTSGFLITRNARKELKRLGNQYNVNYKVRPNKLVSNGIYRYSRHPIYFGLMLIIVGCPMALHTTMAPLYRKKSETMSQKIYGFWFVNALAAFAFFDRVEIPREEHVLRDTFGTKYTNYRQCTPKWIGRPYNDKRNTCNAGTARKQQEK